MAARAAVRRAARRGGFDVGDGVGIGAASVVEGGEGLLADASLALQELGSPRLGIGGLGGIFESIRGGRKPVRASHSSASVMGIARPGVPWSSMK